MLARKWTQYTVTFHIFQGTKLGDHTATVFVMGLPLIGPGVIFKVRHQSDIEVDVLRKLELGMSLFIQYMAFLKSVIASLHYLFDIKPKHGPIFIKNLSFIWKINRSYLNALDLALISSSISSEVSFLLRLSDNRFKY